VIDNLSEKLQGLTLNREEGLQSLLTLINLIPEPAVIYQRDSDEILAANNPLFLLSNLGEKEFIGKPIKTLIPNIVDTDPISGHDKQALLRHKIQPLIPVNIRIFSLSQTKNILLLILKPEKLELSTTHFNNTQADLLEKIRDLIQNKGEPDLVSELRRKLQVTAQILKADLTCIYRASEKKPQLVRFVTNDAVLAPDLPNILTSEEMSNNRSSALWTSLTPATTQLQKAASGANYEFLITIALGHDSVKFGLLVAAGKDTNSSPRLLSTAGLIAAHLSNLMEDQIALNNVRNLTNRIKQVVKIQSEIIANLEEGVIILSPDLTIAEINPSAEAILGYANVEAVRQHITNILIGSESLGSAFSSAQQGIPTAAGGGDLTLHRRNGKSFPAQVMMTPVVRNEKILSVIVLIRDMSQEQQSRAARKQLEQRAILGEVTAIFAHEVRNPINAIMLTLQVMEDNLQGDQENLKWIENMREECNKLLYLMESVLSFAKPLEYKMSVVNLDDMLTRILDQWHTRFLRLNIKPYFESEIQHPLVEGDQRALEQVFTNLISNAVDAMSESGGSLGVKISKSEYEEDRKFLKITITDSGHGIPDDIMEHLFKPFVTGSNRGTGLGLAITQRIVNAHKGKIEIDSFTGGTIFKVFLNKMKENDK